MRLTTLRLQNFRNHSHSYFEFGKSTNLFLGDNGQGKTNVVEAISYLCLTKSFYAGGDSVVLKLNTELFEIEGTIILGAETENKIRIVYEKQQGEKAYFINKKPAEPFSTVIGRFPVVICSPEHHPVTSGGPEERRRFCDFVISQASPLYFKSLIEYRKVLKQRNKILLDSKIGNINPMSLLEPWDEQLVRLGSALVHRRKIFIEGFKDILRSTYHQLIGDSEEPTLEYQPFSEQFSSVDDCARMLNAALMKSKKEEIRIASTLVGPHRDEFTFKINNLDLRKYGSQGQHKTFLVGLKLAEFFYLKNLCNETPLVLLDDIFSELDEHRSIRLLEFVESISQTFITSTSVKWFEPYIKFNEDNRKYVIKNGSVVLEGLSGGI